MTWKASLKIYLNSGSNDDAQIEPKKSRRIDEISILSTVINQVMQV